MYTHIYLILDFMVIVPSLFLTFVKTNPTYILVNSRVMCLQFALGFSHVDNGLKMSSGKLVDSMMESSCLNLGKLDSQ